MRIRVYSVIANYNDKFKKQYIDILKKYNLEIVKDEIEDYFFNKYLGNAYYITIDSVEELFNLSKELKEELIIDYDNNSITIYDDYVE